MRALIAALALVPSLALAQDFSEGSEAKTWNLYAEQPARFEATVVDLLCTFTGDCPEDCGAGRRQLGLLRSADDTLVLPMKNGQPAFSGAAVDLLPYCNQTIEVDGLMIDDPDLGAQNIYLVQRIKADGADWVAANQWTKEWAKANPDAAGKGPWFRRSPRIKAEIEENGYLGLGPEADAAFIADWF
ncbi:hypothetical protein KDD17_10930 [Sulfitobacter albidus]|uniref:Uncharacterized protein n=2 Tax=Sulfitobacter albidus TaxID=2829501 RepID=A0A975PP03_9RHOB|nr:hypothetical protein KDD17_10930 [Sulfitobacter albidus]